MDPFDIVQLGSLGVFLATFVAGTVAVWRRTERCPLRLRPWNGTGDPAAPLLFFTTNLWVAELLREALLSGWQPLPRILTVHLLTWLPVRLAGAGLTAVGLAIFALSVRELGEFWRLGIDSHAPSRLVTTGIYGVSRNPIYLFFNLYLFGAFAMHGTLVLLLFALVMAALLHWQTLIEERVLLRAHTAAYISYRSRVPRYLASVSLWREVWRRLTAFAGALVRSAG